MNKNGTNLSVTSSDAIKYKELPKPNIVFGGKSIIYFETQRYGIISLDDLLDLLNKIK